MKKTNMRTIPNEKENMNKTSLLGHVDGVGQ